jgi:hypothetical protein
MNFDDFSIDELINSIGLKSAQEAGFIKNMSNFALGSMAGSLSAVKETIINFINGKSTFQETVDEVKVTSQTACETYLNFMANKGLDTLSLVIKSKLPATLSPIIDVVKISITKPIIEKINKGLSKVFDFISEKIFS